MTVFANPDNLLEFQDFSAVLNAGTCACHAGGREFEPRRPRHNKLRGYVNILASFFVSNIPVPTLYPTAWGDIVL